MEKGFFGAKPFLNGFAVKKQPRSIKIFSNGDLRAEREAASKMFYK
jgi:hypothetical protein